jgi:hypothetical protein
VSDDYLDLFPADPDKERPRRPLFRRELHVASEVEQAGAEVEGIACVHLIDRLHAEGVPAALAPHDERLDALPIHSDDDLGHGKLVLRVGFLDAQRDDDIG